MHICVNIQDTLKEYLKRRTNQSLKVESTGRIKNDTTKGGSRS